MMTETEGHAPSDNTLPSDAACDEGASGSGIAGQVAGQVAGLVEQARAGDRAAFGALVALHQRPMELYLAGLTGDDEQARDLAQDVFWHAWDRLYELREPERFRAWLFRAATNRARSWLRRRRIVSWVSLDRLDRLDRLRGPHEGPASVTGERPADAAGTAAGAESDFEERLAETDALSRALLRVPLEYRTCLLLHVSLGFSVREVAEQLGATPGAVRMRLHRGLVALREAYRDENP